MTDTNFPLKGFKIYSPIFNIFAVGQYITKYSCGSKEQGNNEIVPKRCDSEQNYVHTTHHLYNQKCSHIFNLQRNENDFINTENENIMFELNELPISPSYDFYDSADSFKPRTQR